MPTPNPTTTTAQNQRRAQLLPALTDLFAQHGYANATTAKLAAATGLRENQLYRLWPSKKAIFLAVLEHLTQQQTDWWQAFFAEHPHTHPADAARKILREEGKQRGHTGQHRIVFAGLSEAHDPDIHQALAHMYATMHRFIQRVLQQQQKQHPDALLASPALAAWSLVALGSFTNIARELDLFPNATQRRLFEDLGATLAGVKANPDGPAPKTRKIKKKQ